MTMGFNPRPATSAVASSVVRARARRSTVFQSSTGDVGGRKTPPPTSRRAGHDVSILDRRRRRCKTSVTGDPCAATCFNPRPATSAVASCSIRRGDAHPHPVSILDRRRRRSQGRTTPGLTRHDGVSILDRRRRRSRESLHRSAPGSHRGFNPRPATSAVARPRSPPGMYYLQMFQSSTGDVGGRKEQHLSHALWLAMFQSSTGDVGGRKVRAFTPAPANSWFQSSTGDVGGRKGTYLAKTATSRTITHRSGIRKCLIER